MNKPDFSLFESKGYFVHHWQRLSGGGNNQLYKVETEKGLAVAKFYCPDHRKRAQHDVLISQALYQNDIHNIPAPIFHDFDQHCALFSFVDGTSCSENVSLENVLQAAKFIKSINASSVRNNVDKSLIASDGFFEVNGHLRNIKTRINKLSQVQLESEIDAEASKFIVNFLEPFFEALSRDLAKLDYFIEPPSRVISPSDFGFHNSLDVDGKLYFLDFEYAGWDDPAKLVADFFSHPAFTISPTWIGEFMANAFSEELVTSFIERLPLMIKLFRVKWICIMLNEFNQVDMARRAAAMNCDNQHRKQQQLIKAQKAFEQINQDFREYL